MMQTVLLDIQKSFCQYRPDLERVGPMGYLVITKIDIHIFCHSHLKGKRF